MNKFIKNYYLCTLLLFFCAIHCQQGNPLSSNEITTQEFAKVKTNTEQWLRASVSDLQQIQGGLTNTSFLATTNKGKFVVRIGKKNPEILGINRFSEIACQKAASAIGIAPQIVYFEIQNGILISEFITGETLSVDKICNETCLHKIVTIMKKYHKIPFNENFKTLSIYEKLRNMLALSMSYKNPFITHEEANEILNIINRSEVFFQSKENLYAGLCHCDLFPPNFIDDGKQIWLIDWEYACWGNILFDIANLCSELNLNEENIKHVLALYFGQTWQKNYIDFEIMNALFNLRNAFWYDLRGKEVEVLGGYNMNEYAKKHLVLFRQIINHISSFHP